MGLNRYIRFDWAAKYMLHNKADFAIFEGLISVLVNDKVTIVELLDTESSKGWSRDAQKVLKRTNVRMPAR